MLQFCLSAKWRFLSWPSALFLAAVLGGCASRGAAPVAVFDLGVAGAGELHPYPLTVEVRLPGWMDNEAMTYRLAYADASQRHEYAQSRWAAPPSQLLLARLKRQLGAAGQGGCLARMEVDVFEQTFVTPVLSQGRLAGRISIFDARRNLLVKQEVAYAIPATTPDASGGVAALLQAEENLAKDGALALDRLLGPDGVVCRETRSR